MEKELSKYYEDQLSLFAEPGWKDLIEKITEIRDVTVDIRNVKTVEGYHVAKGQIDILDWFLNWENMVRVAQKEHEDE
jgi:hypothetical protein